MYNTNENVAEVASAYSMKSLSVEIADSKGNVIESYDNIEVPDHWSYQAGTILASKYLKKRDIEALPLGRENSLTQITDRMIMTWVKYLFQDKETVAGMNKEEYTRSMTKSIFNQVAAPNSPQWFNTGLGDIYGIETDSKHNYYYFDTTSNEIVRSSHSYERNPVSACYILSVDDKLLDPNGIYDLISKEATIFAMGSGSGLNYSNIRGEGEPINMGGKSSGLISFLKILDVSAGAVKSGGSLRRSARMIVLDYNHPDIVEFIEWKAQEEKKAQDLISVGYDSHYEGEAYKTVSGQNANNSVRIDHHFMNAYKNNKSIDLIFRTSKKVKDKVNARDLFKKIANSAHICGCPGLQFDDTINNWHTCKQDGRINASNPCSEYMFLDNTACNLASINLMKFYLPNTNTFDHKAFANEVHQWTMALEASVSAGCYPTPEIAKRSYQYRTLGLGYTNLGSLLMHMGIAYESEAARALAAMITSVMTAQSYVTSSELAKDLQPFDRYKENKDSMLNVMDLHLQVARHWTHYLNDNPKDLTEQDTQSFYQDDTIPANTYHPHHELYKRDGSITPPSTISGGKVSKETQLQTFLAEISRYSLEKWHIVCEKGEKYGFRNAQTTVIAPTGTISFVMDCNTTGIEPDFALVKHKKLSGGGYMTIVNDGLRASLERLGYADKAIEMYEDELMKGTGTVEDIRAWLQPEDVDIFKTAVGRYSISVEAHVDMLAACQPFVSGSISKTCNMPNDAKVGDVMDIYERAYDVGLKCIAIYRDGCKVSQPLNTSKGSKDEESTVSDSVTRVELVKEPLPDRRRSYTQKVVIEGHKLYLTTGEYNDGRLGELFIDMYKEGSTTSGILKALAINVSKGLQYGIPIEEFIETFEYSKFDPAGMVKGDDNVRFVTSVLDYVAKYLRHYYIDSIQNKGVISQDIQEIEHSYTFNNLEPSSTLKSKDSIYTGDSCIECGGSMVKTGSCNTCTQCGTTTGCA